MKLHERRGSFSAFVTALAIGLAVAAVSPAEAACPSCGGANPCTITGTHTIGSGEHCDYTGTTVILSGTFTGDNNAACYTVTAANLNVRGTLRARGSCINVNVPNGEFKMEIVSNSASLVDVRNADSAGDGVSISCGTAVLNGNGINADADGDQTPAYSVAADIDITCSGDISGTGGSLHANGTAGGDSGGDITLTSTGGAYSLTSQLNANGGGPDADGGFVTVDALGNVTAGASNRSLEAQSAQAGFAGEVDIFSGGDVTVNGTINVNGNGEDTDGGSIFVDAGGSVTTGTTWNARADQGGDGGFIDVFAGGGVSTTSAPNSWNVQGASATEDGGWGGAIFVSADDDVTLSGDMDAAGVGEFAFGGDIDISTFGDVTVNSTSRIEADSTGIDADDGLISLDGCNMSVSGDVDTRNTNLDGPTGSNSFFYAGTFTQNSGSLIQADDDGGNDVFCRCPDTSPADGVCDSATCVNSPTFNGTMTPAANIIPLAFAACS